MYVITYKLPGREKTFTAPTIPAAHKLFIKDYAEAAGEVKKVKIEKTILLVLCFIQSTQMILVKLTLKFMRE